MMKKEDFLEKNKGEELVIEVKNEIIKKATIKQMHYEIKEDELYIINGTNLDFAVINLNLVRNYEINGGNMVILLEDKKETKIKIHIKKKVICMKNAKIPLKISVKNAKTSLNISIKNAKTY